MKSLIPAILLLVILAGALPARETVPAQRNLKPSQAAKIIADTPELVILDVRTEDEYDEGRLEGVTRIDFYSRDFDAEVSKLDKKKPYLLYCAVGGRSSAAYLKLKGLGFEDLYHLDGGFKAWAREGLRVEK